jgi:hypothetical protein
LGMWLEMLSKLRSRLFESVSLKYSPPVRLATALGMLRRSPSVAAIAALSYRAPTPASREAARPATLQPAYCELRRVAVVLRSVPSVLQRAASADRAPRATHAPSTAACPCRWAVPSSSIEGDSLSELAVSEARQSRQATIVCARFTARNRHGPTSESSSGCRCAIGTGTDDR